MKKSGLAIIYAGFTLILCGFLAGLVACQIEIEGLDIKTTPATKVDTGPVINGGGNGSGPAPSIALYWDGDEAAERTGDTIIWPAFDLGTRTPVTVTKTALAVFKNPPAGFEYLQWTFETDTNAKADASEDGLLAFGDAWHPGAQDTGLSEMPINAGLGVTEAKITVWNCDSTGTRGTVSAFFIPKVVEFGTPMTPTLQISWNGDNFNETLTWWKSSGPLDLTAAITDPPAGSQVRWTIDGPADVVVFDGYTAGNPVSPADAVKIKTGANFGMETVTVTAALEGYPEVTESFTIIPGPVVLNFTTVPGGYTGSAFITYYNSTATLDVTVNAAGELEYASGVVPTGAVKSLTLTGPTLAGGNKEHLIGRTAPNSILPIVLKLKANGDLSHRDAVGGSIPISSYAEFQLISTAPDGKYKQEVDLDLMDVEWTPVGSSGSQFTGTFDGGGKTLSNLKIEKTGDDNVGLFGVVGSGGEVKSVGILSGSVKGKNNVGGLAGSNNGDITACYNAAGVTVTGNGDNVGGLVGSNNGDITGCYNEAGVTVTGNGDNVGGLVGSNNGDITGCYNEAGVTVTGNGDNVGGVVGLSNKGTITGCYNEAGVTVTGTGNNVGGVVGDMQEGDIFASYNKADVTGSDHVGGVAGNMEDGTIIACYNNAVVNGAADVGGVAGTVGDGTITAVYNTGAVSGTQDYVGGLIGSLGEGEVHDSYNTGKVNGGVAIQGSLAGNAGSTGFVRSTWAKDTSDSALGDPIWMPAIVGFSSADGFTPEEGGWTTGDGTDGNYWKVGTVAGMDGVSDTTTPHPLPRLWYEE
ncbi:hypothetical protein AGMMS50255_0500 [Spirochaetia bacterium]|nr:hypothetical protein AGMMS50255_0500 [Spirochaetia bacterium]